MVRVQAYLRAAAAKKPSQSHPSSRCESFAGRSLWIGRCRSVDMGWSLWVSYGGLVVVGRSLWVDCCKAVAD